MNIDLTTTNENRSILSFKPATFEFDRHKFVGSQWGTMTPEMAPFFDIAYRAKRGDEAAIAVATAMKLYIIDAFGTTYVDYR